MIDQIPYEKTITVKPVGGLANRIRVLESVFQYAQKHHFVVKIIWEKSFLLNCSFQRLFKLPENTELIEFKRPRFVMRVVTLSQLLFKLMGISIPFGYDYYLIDKDVRNIANIEAISLYKKIYIRTFCGLSDQNTESMLLSPVEDLMHVVDRVTMTFNQNTIGVHIRRRDNKKAIKFSPSEEFINTIDGELIRNPDVSVFLATDSPAEESNMKRKYPGKVITLPKSLDRNTENGIRDALIDLYCLSNTARIYGSYYSSFSEVAAQIGNKPLTTIYKPLNH